MVIPVKAFMCNNLWRLLTKVNVCAYYEKAYTGLSKRPDAEIQKF